VSKIETGLCDNDLRERNETVNEVIMRFGNIDKCPKAHKPILPSSEIEED